METECDNSGRKGKSGQWKNINTANEKRTKGNSKNQQSMTKCMYKEGAKAKGDTEAQRGVACVVTSSWDKLVVVKHMLSESAGKEERRVEGKAERIT